MIIDWNNFTPWSALAGGALIGISTALFILLNGRIAGITGIIGGLFRPVMHDAGWRIAFTIGLIIAPVSYTHLDVYKRQLQAHTAPSHWWHLLVRAHGTPSINMAVLQVL